MAEIFISYAHEDAEVIKDIILKIEQDGHIVSIDKILREETDIITSAIADRITSVA
jgi:hypothetical protein